MATEAELATLATFAASWAVVHVAHNLADHVTGQTDWQADNKGAPTSHQIAAGANPHTGWPANLAHVGQYHATLLLLGSLAWLVLPLHWSAWGITTALLWSAATHAFLDRRWPVRWLLDHIGKKGFARLNAGGLNGIYLTDQALHSTALSVSAVLLATL
ncbi:hypothetical protein GCM10022222_51450 [Amycolatopsis ultiminotia]|uniref:DUF3307 domain-containing protein n=1 Tax=Amycolatopsis ultiminotia TaxID=543629 RepID=A0ABP6X4J2_9PSEU